MSYPNGRQVLTPKNDLMPRKNPFEADEDQTGITFDIPGENTPRNTALANSEADDLALDPVPILHKPKMALKPSLQSSTPQHSGRKCPSTGLVLDLDYDHQSFELLAAGHPGSSTSSEDEQDDYSLLNEVAVDVADKVSVAAYSVRQPSLHQPSLHQTKSTIHSANPFVGKTVTKEAIVRNWLPRYTGVPLEEFGDYILLCNFHRYVQVFAEMHNVEIKGQDKPIMSATANNITIMNFGMGSAAMATTIDLLSALKPRIKGILFLGKCGGLKKSIPIGSLILPIAAIRGEGTSDEYMDPKVPALPAFALQKAISEAVEQLGDVQLVGDALYTGPIYTTNQRVWEHRLDFKQRLRDCRAIGIDMETATLFIVAFANKIPAGALLLVSDMPLVQEGIKSAQSDAHVTKNFVDNHFLIGLESMKYLQKTGKKVKHLKF